MQEVPAQNTTETDIGTTKNPINQSIAVFIFEFETNLQQSYSRPVKVKLLRARKGAHKENPSGGLNPKIIDVERQGTKSKVTIKQIEYTNDDHSKGNEMFASKIL